MADEKESRVIPQDKGDNGVAPSISSRKDFLSPTDGEKPPVPLSSSASDTADEIDAEKGEASTDVDEVPPRDISGWKWGVVVGAILSSTFLFALDNTIVAVVQPAIVLQFNSVGKISWLSVAFLMGAAATNLIWGKVYGQFNGKWTYILCVFLFELGSAVCGAAPSMNALIIGRAICGVGGSGMYVGVMTLLAATTTLHERPMYVGGTGLTWGLGTVLGPIIGGAFTDSPAGWRWAFYINLIIGAACAPVYLFMLPNKDPRTGVSLKDRAREMDYVGSILTIGAFVSGVMAISFGGVTYEWNSGQIIGLFVCSGVLFTLLGLQQVFTIFTTVSRRIVPVEFFRSRTMLILFCCTSAGGASMVVTIYMLPLFFQFIHSDTALQSGVRLLPFIFLLIVAVIANGAILSAYGYYMPWYTVGGILVVCGGALMFTVNSTSTTSSIYGYSILIGVGTGFFAQASFSVAQAVVAIDMVPSAIGFITCAQVIGCTISLAIANSVFLNGCQTKIEQILPGVSKYVIQEAIAGAGSAFVKGLEESQRVRVLAAIVDSMGKTYVLVFVGGALVTVLSLGMKREKLFLAAGAA